MLKVVKHVFFQTDPLNLTKLRLKHKINCKIEEPDWQCGIIKELLQMRDTQSVSNLSYEEIKLMLDRITTDFLGS